LETPVVPPVYLEEGDIFFGVDGDAGEQFGVARGDQLFDGFGENF
jgi:hypothetical protein